jgi:hypothetical protein
MLGSLFGVLAREMEEERDGAPISLAQQLMQGWINSYRLGKEEAQQHHHPTVLQKLVDAFSASDPIVRRNAADILGDIGQLAIAP